MELESLPMDVKLGRTEFLIHLTFSQSTRLQYFSMEKICILKKYATLLGNRLQGTWGLCSQVNKGVRDQKEFIISLH